VFGHNFLQYFFFDSEIPRPTTVWMQKNLVDTRVNNQPQLGFLNYQPFLAVFVWKKTVQAKNRPNRTLRAGRNPLPETNSEYAVKTKIHGYKIWILSLLGRLVAYFSAAN